MWREQVSRRGGSCEVGVQAEHDVDLRSDTFEFEAREQGRPVSRTDEFEVTVAGFFEIRFDYRTGAPIGNETIIGHYSQDGFVLGMGDACDCNESRCDEGGFHSVSSIATEGSGLEVFQPSLRRH